MKKPAFFHNGRWWRCLGYSPRTGYQIGIKVDPSNNEAIELLQWLPGTREYSTVPFASYERAQQHGGEDYLIRAFTNLCLTS